MCLRWASGEWEGGVGGERGGVGVAYVLVKSRSRAGIEPQLLG